MPQAVRATALAAVKPFPVLLVRGDSDALPAQWCDLPLLPNTEPANGLPSWSAADGSLHLYWYRSQAGMIRGWRLCNQLTPASNACLAGIRTAVGELPPYGEHNTVMWDQGMVFRGVTDGEGFVEAPLTLLLGREAQERVHRLEVCVPKLSS